MMFGEKKGHYPILNHHLGRVSNIKHMENYDGDDMCHHDLLGCGGEF